MVSLCAAAMLNLVQDSAVVQAARHAQKVNVVTILSSTVIY